MRAFLSVLLIVLGLFLSPPEARAQGWIDQPFDPAADPVVAYMTADQLAENCRILEQEMRKAAKQQDFINAAQLRDELFAMRKLLEERQQASNEA